jgi:hypothetical protein
VKSAAKLLFGCLGLCRFCLGVLAAEAFYTASRVHELLLAGEEWMAGGADFHVNIAFMRRTSRKLITTGTQYLDLIVSGMNSCLHVWLNPNLGTCS